MGKKNKAQKTFKASVPEMGGDAIGSLGWKIIAGGAALVLAGFFTLTQADPMGRNWAADLSPFLILGGYALVGLGIFWPEPGEGGENPPSLPPARP